MQQMVSVSRFVFFTLLGDDKVRLVWSQLLNTDFLL